jgi:PTS system nitrogen regulatory IIA component
MYPACAVRAPLRLADLFPPRAIRVGLEQPSKPAAIEALVRHAVGLGYLRLEEVRSVLDTILARENLASTGLGHGLALPHCQCKSLDRLVGVAGLLHRGIPYDAMDGEPVDWVFLTLAPSDTPDQSFEALGRLAAVGRNKSLLLLLRECRTAEQISAFLEELDRPVAGSLDELAWMSLTRLEREQGDPWRDMAYFTLTRVDRPTRDREGRRIPEPRWL